MIQIKNKLKLIHKIDENQFFTRILRKKRYPCDIIHGKFLFK